MDNEETKMGVLVKWVNHTFEQRVNEVLKDHNLTRAQCDLLLYVAKTQEKHGVKVTQRDIEKEFHISNPTVTGLLKRLEAKDFLERQTSSKDARFKYIILKPKALDVLDEIHIKLDHNEINLLSCLTDEEKVILKELLTKIVKAL